jgi:hypothetical protein
MIQTFVDRFMAATETLKKEFREKRPEGYTGLVTRLIEAITDVEYTEYNPDPKRITVINHGDYQGTMLFIIAAKGYQPSKYWSIFVDYGSCSGCDAFEANQGWDDEIPEKEVDGNWTMMLHMVQGMKVV